MQKYQVMKGSAMDAEGKSYEVGEEVILDAALESTQILVADGILATIQPAPTPEIVLEEKKEEVTAPIEPGTPSDAEPRLRYKGQVILTESERIVGERTFKHILCVNGTEFDLLDEEYRTEVKMSYPPHTA